MKVWRTSEDISQIGIDIADVLVRSGLAASKSAARRAIEQKSVRLGDCLVEDKFARLTMWEGEFVLLERG